MSGVFLYIAVKDFFLLYLVFSYIILEIFCTRCLGFSVFNIICDALYKMSGGLFPRYSVRHRLPSRPGGRQGADPGGHKGHTAAGDLDLPTRDVMTTVMTSPEQHHSTE